MKNIACITLFLSCFLATSQKIELVIPTGHTGQIKKIDVSADSNYVASIQNTSSVILWDRKSGEIDRVLNLHKARVNDLLFLKDKLYTAGEDASVNVWNHQTKSLERTLHHQGKIASLFADDNYLYALGKDGLLIRWELLDFQKADTLNTGLKHVSSSHNRIRSELIITSRNELSLINLDNWSITKSSNLQEDLINTIFYDDSLLLIGTTKGILIDVDNEALQEKRRTQAFKHRMYHISAYSGDSLLLSGRSDGSQLKLLSYQSFKLTEPAIDLGLPSNLSRGGIQTFTVSSTSILIPDYDYGITSFDTSLQESNRYQGLSFPLNDVSISYGEKFLAVASSDNEIKIYDLTGVRPPVILNGHIGGVTSLAFHPSDTMLASVGLDSKLRIWNLNSTKQMYSYTVKGEYINTPISFDVSGQYIIQKTSRDFFELFSLEKSRSKKIKIDDGLKFRFYRNGEKILFATREGLYIYNALDLKEERFFPYAQARDFDVQGETILVLKGQKLEVFDLQFNKKTSIDLQKGYDKIYLNPNQKQAIATINSAKKGSSERDYRLKSIDLESGDISQLEGHTAFTSRVSFLENGKFTLSSAKDGQLIFWENKVKRGTLVPLKGAEWISLTPVGIYDASQNAFDKMHYVRGNERFEMDQLKDLYYEPKLIPRILGNIPEPLPERKALNTIAPYPEIDIKYPQLNDGILGLNIKNNGGGVGYVVIKINGKEVLRELDKDSDEDAVLLDYPINGHPFLKASKLNRVTVKAYNGDGTVTSPEKGFFYFGDHQVGHDKVKPKLFAVVAGTDDYPGESMDLTYAGKDANDFAAALSLASTNFYGEENTHIKVLNTKNEDRNLWPTKTNIKESLASFKSQATAQDVLVIYLSGHGTNYKASDKEEFYYLAADATDDLSDPAIREQATISTAELTHWIKEIPTLQQVLILDACHSGKVTSEIEELTSINTNQLKSLETMKDRTGLFILAGSESDHVSFESSVYEQGLLTYSILFGMKGATLSEGGKINIIDLFQFVTKKVPELASEIGQMQMPEVKIPSESDAFTLGSISSEDQEKISIVTSKPVFIQSGFQEQNQFNDPLHLGAKIDRTLLKISSQPERPLVFLDKKFFNSAYLIKGRYQVLDNYVRAEIKLYKDAKKIKEFSLSATNSKILAEKIVDATLKQL